jgi:hypothetical protein
MGRRLSGAARLRQRPRVERDTPTAAAAAALEPFASQSNLFVLPKLPKSSCASMRIKSAPNLTDGLSDIC